MVKYEAKNIYKDKIWSFFVCFRSLLTVITIYQPINLADSSCGFQKYQNSFNQKIYLAKNLAVTVVYFCCGRIFH